ncbi:MAG: eL32 family ribosomal protein [archaeon]
MAQINEKHLEHRALVKSRKPRFVRKDWNELSKLGEGRRKKQRWRKPKGRHNKLRAKKRSVGKMPGVGYRSPRTVRGSLHGLKPVMIYNVSQLQNLKSGEIAVVANVGAKKRITILEKAGQSGIKISNAKEQKNEA